MNVNQIAWWDDAIVGDKRESFGRTITEADLSILCGLAGSYVPLHNDAEYAKTTPYGQRIVNAMMSLVVASGLRVSMIWYNGDNFCGASMLANLGLDRVKFPAPLFINDTIHLEITVQSKKETSNPERGVITFLDQVIKQDGTVVAQWERTMMFRTRPVD